MAYIDRIYGTQKQYNELKKWLKVNEKPIKCKMGIDLSGNAIYAMVLPSWRLCARKPFGFDESDRPISNFLPEIDKWLWDNCDIEWLREKLLEQGYGD